jgi:hypothetical protein
LTITEDSEYWGWLARRINEGLRASSDNGIRSLWIDCLVPGTLSPQLERNEVAAMGFVSEDSGRSFQQYRITLRLSPSAADAYRMGEWRRLLPETDSATWLTVSRANRKIGIECA